MNKEIVLEVKLESETVWTKLVIYKNEPIPLSKSLLELQDISKQKVDQSKTIYLPSEEPVNQSYFGQFELVSNNTFLPYNTLEARVTVDNNTIIRGLVYFKGFNKLRREYEVLISGKAGNVSGKLGEQTMDALVDPTTSSSIRVKYDHTLTVDNVIDTWSGAAAHVNIFYPLNDWGSGYGLIGNTKKINPLDGLDGALWDITSGVTPIAVEDFRPSIKLFDAVKDVFSINDMVVNTDALIAAYPHFSDLHCLLTIPETSEELVNAHLGATSEFISNPSAALPGNTQVRFRLDGSADSFMLYDVNSSGTINGTLTAIRFEPDSGLVNVDARVDFHTNGSVVDNTIIKLQLWKRATSSNTFSLVLETTKTIDFEDGNEDLSILLSIDDVSVIAGNEFMVSFDCSGQLGMIDSLQCTTLDMYSRDEDIFNRRNIKSYLQPLKQFEFVKGVLTHFGLFLDYDASDDTFYIKTYDMFDTGITRDWTSKMEYAQEFKIKSLSDTLAPQYLYETGDSNSYLNDAIQEYYETSRGEGYNYGSFKLDLGLQLAAKESEFKSFFSPCMVVKYRGLAPGMDGLQISRSFKDVSAPKQTGHKYELFYKEASYTPDDGIIIRDRDLNNIPNNFVPAHSTVKNNMSCYFRWTDGFEEVNRPADLFGSIHIQRWAEWIGLEYVNATGPTKDLSKLNSARIIEANVWLDTDDYNTFKFGDKITFDSEFGTATYRVLNITGFDPYERKACAVKLIKIV